MEDQLDANVLVRYLAADDAKQLAEAEQVIEGCRHDAEPLFLSAVVMCETMWVLERSYKLSKPAIIGVLESILEKDLFQIEHDSALRRSLHVFRAGNGSFADYLIGEIARQAGCRDTVTFDRALRGAVGFTALA